MKADALAAITARESLGVTKKLNNYTELFSQYHVAVSITITCGTEFKNS